METYRVLVIDDSDEEAATIAGHLDRYAADHGVHLQVTRLRSAVEFVAEKHDADLIFMDIDLPGINGMEAAEELRTRDAMTPLIFVTNLAQYAVAGYQVDALDFMVKPCRYADFAMRMDRAMRAVRRNGDQRIAIPTAAGVRLVSVHDIVFVELQHHDLVYHTADEADRLRARGSIRQAVESLPASSFVQLSQGCLANMAHVGVVRSDSVEMDDGTPLYFSRSRRRDCLETLSRYFGTTI